MVVGLVGVVLVLVAMMVVPAGIYASIRLVNRLFGGSSPERLPPSLALDARLRRMEEAIDAMSQQVERLREASERRYVTEGDEQTPRLSRSLDSPPAP